jgi:predicted kinase
MNKDNVLFIMRGLPGSGKSTAAEILADRGTFFDETSHFVVATADDYFMKDGEYKFDASKLGAAHKACQKKVEKAMIEGDWKIFVANTSTTEKELNDYYKLANKYGYMVVSMIVENRHDGKNEHGVPDIALNRMFERFNIKLI